MAYANTSFSRGRTFGATTYALLAVAVCVTIGLAGAIGSLDGNEQVPMEPFGGFQMENVAKADR